MSICIKTAPRRLSGHIDDDEHVAKQTAPMPELLCAAQAHAIDAGSAEFERNCGSGEALARAGMPLLRLVHRHLIVGSVVLVGLILCFTDCPR